MALERATRPRQIPALTRITDPAIREALIAIKENIEVYRGTGPNSEPLDVALTPRDLLSTGVFGFLVDGNVITFPPGDGGIVPVIPVPDLTVPPIPTGLVINGSLGVILLQWDSPEFNNYAHTEVWRSATDDLGTAVLIGTSQGLLYADVVGASATYYYWIRHVSTSNPPVFGPFNATAGTLGETGDDPTYLLSVLTASITSGQLHIDLSSQIDEIPGIISQIDSINTILSDLSGTPEYDTGTDYFEDDVVTYSGGLYRALTDMTSPAPVPTNPSFWAHIGDYSSISDAVAALAVFVDDHETRITTNEGDISANATDITAVQVSLSDAENDISVNASAISSLSSTVSSQGGTISTHTSQISALSTTVGTHTAQIATKASITSVTTVSNDLDDVEDDVTNILAEYTIKLDVNGHVAGIGLINSGITSQVGILADEFFIAHPSGGTDLIPFVVSGGIVHIANASIIDLTANNFVGDTINANTVTAGISISTPSITGGTLSLVDSLSIGNATFGLAGIQLQRNSGNPRVYIGNGASSYLQYQAGSLTVSGNITGSSITGGTITGADIIGTRFRTDTITTNERIDINPSGDNRLHYYDNGAGGAVNEMCIIGYGTGIGGYNRMLQVGNLDTTNMNGVVAITAFATNFPAIVAQSVSGDGIRLISTSGYAANLNSSGAPNTNYNHLFFSGAQSALNASAGDGSMKFLQSGKIGLHFKNSGAWENITPNSYTGGSWSVPASTTTVWTKGRYLYYVTAAAGSVFREILCNGTFRNLGVSVGVGGFLWTEGTAVRWRTGGGSSISAVYSRLD